MTHLTKALLLVSGLALAACSSDPRYAGGSVGDNGDNGGVDSDSYGAGGIDRAGLGSASDPNSPAYFQERVGDRVLFTVDESRLTDEARETLRGQARWLRDNPDFQIVIEGHADERGTREYNLALGARRASAAESFLADQGIDSRRMRTVSYGKERPVEACPEQRCWDANRRAVTALSSGAGS